MANSTFSQWNLVPGGTTTSGTTIIQRPGPVGIGSSFNMSNPPFANLHIRGNGTYGSYTNLPHFVIENNLIGQENLFKIFYSNAPAPGINLGNGSVVIQSSNPTNSDILFMPNPTTAGLTIKNDGKVGIGAAVPNANLEILESKSNTPSSLYIRTYSNANSKIFTINNLGSYGFLIDDKAIGHIVSNVNLAQHPAMLTWDENGNFLFGEQNIAVPPNGTSLLSVKGKLNTAVSNFKSTSNGSYNYNTIFDVDQYLTKAIVVQKTNSSQLEYEPFTVYGNGLTRILHKTVSGNNNVFEITDAVSNNTNFIVKNNGYVYAREINIQLGNFPDYVFNKNYALMSLEKLESYINEYNHLPNIPSAKEVEKNGANIGDLSKIQMEKIEELTLYIIELKKEIEQIKKQVK